MILYVVIVTLSYIGLKKNNKKYASVAQLVEHLICTQAVEGSTPFRSSLVLDQESKTWVASNCSHLNRRLAQFVSSGGILKTYFWGYRIAAIAADCKSAPSGSEVRVLLPPLESSLILLIIKKEKLWIYYTLL